MTTINTPSHPKALRGLREKLWTLPSGPVDDPDGEITSALATVWHLFSGGDDTSMASYKICRTENLRWQCPVLSFNIERHGGTVLGSSRAEVQEWDVNLETLSVTHHVSGSRQLRPMSPRLHTKQMASEVAAQISRREKTAHLRWLQDGRVGVAISVLIPTTNLRTTTGRRKRFASQLHELLQPMGWHRVPGSALHIYQRTCSSTSS